MVSGAVGAEEEDGPRMVTTPWCDREIPMTEAAEIGTKKVMEDHCSIGLVVTTDGTVTDIPRQDYLDGEARAIRDMAATGKPFLVIVNSRVPGSETAAAAARHIREEFGLEPFVADCQALDLEGIGSAVSRVLPQKYRLRLAKLKSGACQVGVKYLKSYLCLMGVTFALSLMGLLFLRVDYALLLAFLISLVDLFPILGVGTILVPWGVWCLTLGGSPFLGIGLLVLWGVCSLTRQFLEPRLLGDSLGVHPLLTLFAMYLGLRLAGVAGMLLLPALCVPLTSFLRDRSGGEEKTA
jgi:hypothetical protein